jgi:hypothetical protein
MWLLLLTLPVKVKFRDPASGLDCDLNVNGLLGLHNSSLVKEYCNAHPYLRPLLFRIKEWANPLGLNSPSPTLGSPVSFSSYALALMTIGFLQVSSLRYYHFRNSSYWWFLNRKTAICLIYRRIFLLRLIAKRILFGLLNPAHVGMSAIDQPKIGFHHLFLILIRCCLRGSCRWFCIDDYIVA